MASQSETTEENILSKATLKWSKTLKSSLVFSLTLKYNVIGATATGGVVVGGVTKMTDKSGSDYGKDGGDY